MQSFTDFRNEWRIIYAKKLIKEGKATGMTLEAIGLLSGFTSRNTFFTAFKKREGVSPGVFAARKLE
jgi:AraC-like DNA-binding protein